MLEFTVGTFFFLIFGVSSFFLFLKLKGDAHWTINGFFLLLSLTLLYCSYNESTPETIKERQAARIKAAEEQKARGTPRVISETDGCKVYAFESAGKWHYFTRCQGSNTSTNTTHTKCDQSGKIRTCNDYTTSIETKDER